MRSCPAHWLRSTGFPRSVRRRARMSRPIDTTRMSRPIDTTRVQALLATGSMSHSRNHSTTSRRNGDRDRVREMTALIDTTALLALLDGHHPLHQTLRRELAFELEVEGEVASTNYVALETFDATRGRLCASALKLLARDHAGSGGRVGAAGRARARARDATLVWPAAAQLRRLHDAGRGASAWREPLHRGRRAVRSRGSGLTSLARLRPPERLPRVAGGARADIP